MGRRLSCRPPPSGGAGDICRMYCGGRGLVREWGCTGAVQCISGCRLSRDSVSAREPDKRSSSPGGEPCLRTSMWFGRTWLFLLATAAISAHSRRHHHAHHNQGKIIERKLFDFNYRNENINKKISFTIEFVKIQK